VEVSLKKSAVIAFTIKRLFQNQLTSAFSTLREATKALKFRQTTEASILAISCAEVFKHKEANLLHSGFDQLRRMFTASFVHDVKLLLTATVGHPNQTGLNILHSFFRSKLRETFKKLDNK
jgi:hypothetical protein